MDTKPFADQDMDAHADGSSIRQWTNTVNAPSEPPYAAEQSRLFYRTDSAIEPWHRAALNVQCTDCPSSSATERTSHHVYRFWTALLQSRLRRTCSIHISHESAVKGLQKKCCDERNVFIVIGYSIVNLSSQPCLANIKIAEAVLGSPCIYFRHSFYMYFS